MVLPGTKGVSLKELFRRFWRELQDDAITDSAAQLSYYFLFSLFPLLFFLVTLTAYLPLGGTVEALLAEAELLMPGQAVDLVRGHLDELLKQPRPKLVTLGFVTTLWTASRGVDALRKALNLAYDVPESRPYWRTQLLAITMTVAGTMLFLLAFTFFTLGGNLGHWLIHKVTDDESFHVLLALMRWPFTVVVVTFTGALMYYALPDVKQKFKFITPGSVMAALLWVGTTWVFTYYVEQFGKYNVTYGSIGGVIVLMLWLYISGLILILGGEINSVIEHAALEGKAPGERAPGEPALPAPEGEAIPITAGAAKRAESARRLRWKLWRWRRSKPPKPQAPRPV